MKTTMQGFTITAIETLVVENCINCGVLFAFPAELQAELKKSHGTFHCPNGHGQHYTRETEAEKLRKALKAEQEKARKEREELEAKHKKENRELWEWGSGVTAERDEARRKLGTTRGQLTKMKKRIAASVCPCCNKSFPNDKLHQHIKTKHPDFTTEEQP